MEYVSYQPVEVSRLMNIFTPETSNIELKRFYNTPLFDHIDVHNPNYGANMQADSLYDSLIENAVESDSIQREVTVSTSKKLTDAIQKHLGESYSQSKRGQSGFSDCSSFVGKVLKDAGINTFAGLPTAKAMYDSGKLQSVTKAKPGDLIFFRGTDNRGSDYISHIGIIAEVDSNGNPTKMAHASARQYKKTVVVDYNPNYWNKYKPEIKRLKT